MHVRFFYRELCVIVVIEKPNKAIIIYASMYVSNLRYYLKGLSWRQSIEIS